MADTATDRAPTPRDSLAPEWPAALLRIYLGVVFLVAGIEQLAGADPWGPARDWPTSLARYDAAARAQTASFYTAFLHSVLVPHKDLVAAVVPSLHVLIGVFLLLGLATRLTAAAALFLLANYMALTGVLPYQPDPTAALAALALAVFLARPDTVWSARTVLADRLRRRPA